VSQAQRLLLPRVADLHHVADPPHHCGLLFFPPFFEETLQRRGIVEMIFDGILSFSGHDDDVLDPGHRAFFHHVLNLRLVDHREHFFGLGLGRRQKARAQARGRQNRFPHPALRNALCLRRVAHRFPRWAYFFFAGFFSFASFVAVSFVPISFSLLVVFLLL